MSMEMHQRVCHPPKNQESSEQAVSIKFENEVTNYFRHLMERFNDRITLQNLRFSERYINELYVLLHRLGNGEEYVPPRPRARISS